MRAAAILFLAIVGALAAATGERAPAPGAEGIDLVLPGGMERLRLQLAIKGESHSIDTTWTAFLDQWFDWFDRDGDGVLTRGEAARIFPLPLPDGRSVAFDFDQADAARNGKITRAELKTFYRRAGFAPVLTRVVPPSLEDLQVAEAMFHHLGAGKGGKLTVEHLNRAETLLRKLDENDDEELTPAEVLSLGSPRTTKTPLRSDFKLVLAQDRASGPMVRVVFGKEAIVGVEQVGKGPVLLPASPGNAIARIRHADVVLTFAAGQEDPAKSMALSRQFVVNQFKNVAGARGWLEKKQVQDDLSLQVLMDLFAHADRNGDGKLTLGELEQFLGLIEKGVTCPLVVVVSDRGRNLFQHLDSNGDGRLDSAELHAAARLVKDLDGSDGWTRGQVPHALQVTVQRGFAGSSFGPLPLVAVRKPASVVVNKGIRGPAWFRAMDRNGDGFVSRSEFLGPPELFRELDLDGDGRISAAEAEGADARRVGK
jgi:Ca2+-binding EF-hand superfamily protein